MTSVPRQPANIETTLALPEVIFTLQRLRDSENAVELLSVLERIVALGPQTLELQPLLHDAAGVLMSAYMRLLAPWSQPVSRNPCVLLPERFLHQRRVAEVLRLLQSQPLAWVVQQSSLVPLETCAILGLLQRLGVLLRDEATEDVDPPPELAEPFQLPPLARARLRRTRLAAALRGRQAHARAGPSPLSPWALCSFVRDAGQVLPPNHTAAMVVVVDALAPLGALRCTDGMGRSDQWIPTELIAHVLELPPGRVTLSLMGRGYGRRAWTFECGADEVVFVSLSRSWLSWRANTEVREF